jgi:hypothetical protein
VLGWGEHNSLVDGFFLGADILLGSNYSFLAEYDGSNLNAGVRWPFSDKFRGTVGYANEKLFVGTEYQLH